MAEITNNTDNADKQSADDKDTDNSSTDSSQEGDQDDGPALKEDGTPYTKADIAAIQEAATKVRRELRALKKTKEGGVGNNGSGGDQSQGTPPDPEKIKADAEAAATAKWKPRAIRTAARAAFVEAGLVIPKGVEGEAAISDAVRLLDIEDLDFTDDGDVEGIEEQVAGIKRRLPGLFANSRGVGRIDGADKGGHGSGKARSASERQAEYLWGRAR